MQPPENCPLTQAEWNVCLATFAGGEYRPSTRVGPAIYLSPSAVRSHLFYARRKLKAADNEDLRKKLIDREWMGVHGGVRQRRDHAAFGQERELSPALKAYLAAFDELLRNWRSPESVDHAHEQMRYHLAGEVVGQRLSPELIRGSQRPTVRRSLNNELPRFLLPGLA